MDINKSDTTGCFDVLLTVHRSIFISVFNQIDAQNLFHNRFYFMPLHVFEHMCSKHVEAWNKLIIKQDFVHYVG